MNRYVIEGLLKDLIYRNKQIIVASATYELGTYNILGPMKDEMHSYRWGYHIERAGKDFIETRGGGRADFVSLRGPRGLEGRRADIWVVYGRAAIPLVYLDPAMQAIQREAQRTDPNAEIILLD